MPLPQRVSSVTAALLPPVLLPMPVESAAGPATLPLGPPSFAEQASSLSLHTKSSCTRLLMCVDKGWLYDACNNGISKTMPLPPPQSAFSASWQGSYRCII